MTNKEKPDVVKTSIDELFRTTQSDELADLLDGMDISLTDEQNTPPQLSPSNQSTPDIVITDIEISPAKVKIGQIQLNGKFAKCCLGLVVILITVGLFYQPL